MKSLHIRTEVPVNPSDWKIDYQTPVLTVGSCFAEVLGSQLSEYKLPVLNNPFGTVFNPYSIAKLLTMALEGTPPNEELYVQNADGIWLHYDFHSTFWADSREALEEQLKGTLARVRDFLNTSEVLVVTFGTAYVYRYKKNLSLVSNCHKTPQNEFVKELLGYEQLLNLWSNVLRALKHTRKVILTVSPVRHTRDTLPLNQVSKSVLRLLCHRLTEQHANVSYFPSYEMMLDDLRDYRFYEDDLIHPSTWAEEYIFQKFAESYLDSSVREGLEEWDKVRKMMAHRPQHGLTESYRLLLINVKSRLEKMAETLPVSPEMKQIEDKLREFPGQTKTQ
ncbi:GSCFA domain-containing protein [Salmonirosea aquatica]|uniref:GSCFA domain-containing protein n=1 Tax=Salmonirosea aquatica TaxID=2654236 RepID=A0A7C9FX95_9BACT|nr:GSCFA domain-containing protein [Cytophagaceae bacterium SJW1-29]